MKLWMPTTKLAASSQTVAAVVVASSSSSAVANVNSTPGDAKQVSPMRTGNFPASSSSSSSSSSQSRLIGTSASTTTTTTEPTALTSVTTTGPQPLGKQPRSDNIPIPETITTTSAQGRREQDLSREIEQENKQVEDEVLAEYRDHVMFQRIYGPRPRQSQSRNHCLPPRRRTPRGEAVNRRASSTHTNQPPPPPFSHIYLHQQQPYHGHPPPHKFIPFALLQHPPDFAPVVASQLDPRCCCPCSSNDHYHHAPMTATPVVVLTPPTTSAATFTPATICPLQQHLNHNRLTSTGFEITNTGPMLSYPEVEGVFELDL